MADAERLFAWRMDAVTRFYSLTQHDIEWNGHLNWLERSLANPDRALFVARFNGEPVGTVRIDRGEETVISVTVAPEHRRTRLSEPLLAAALPHDGCVAYIKKANLASHRMVSAVGFVLTHDGSIQRWTHPGLRAAQGIACLHELA